MVIAAFAGCQIARGSTELAHTNSECPVEQGAALRVFEFLPDLAQVDHESGKD